MIKYRKLRELYLVTKKTEPQKMYRKQKKATANDIELDIEIKRHYQHNRFCLCVGHYKMFLLDSDNFEGTIFLLIYQG